MVLEESNITRDDLWDMSKRLTLCDAARHLKIGTTKFKKICRSHGMQSWPYRLFKSYKKMLDSPFFSENDKNKIKVIISSAANHQFVFSADQLMILHQARQKAYRYEYNLKS